MRNPNALSYTTVEKASRCPREYQNYRKWRTLPSVNMEMGNIVEDIAKNALTGRLSHMDDEELYSFVTLYMEQLETIHPDPSEKDVAKMEKFERSLPRLLSLRDRETNARLAEKTSRMNPAEITFEDLKETFNGANWSPEIIIDGMEFHPDVILEDGSIIDVKNYSQLPDVDASYQLATYQWAAQIRGLKCPRVGYLVINKGVTPVITLLIRPSYNDHFIGMLEQTFARARDIIDSGDDTPNLSACEQKFGRCSYWQLCHKNDTTDLKERS